jgi:hypothetical protein
VVLRTARLEVPPSSSMSSPSSMLSLWRSRDLRCTCESGYGSTTIVRYNLGFLGLRANVV